MKKIFTLLAAVLLVGNAFGQQKYKNIVVNGDFEKDAPAYAAYPGIPADAWNSFWVHEWPKGEVGEEQYQGTATIVDGLGVDGSRCAKVVARSEAQADECQNKVTPSGQTSLASWDCQFFIYATEPMPVDKIVRLTMWVKADKDGTIESQAHYGPGDYNHYQLFGNISVTTEWKQYQAEITVSADHVKESDGKAFQSVAFNLSTNVEGNVFYFDNIKLEMKDPKEQGDGEVSWINFLRKGIYSADHITGTSPTEGDFECTNFTVQDLNKPEGEQQQPAPVVEVPGEPGVFAVKVPVPGYYIEEVADLDEEGNEQFDDDGNIKTKSVYYWNDGREVGTSAPARWQCQFFVSTLHKMVSGERYKFKFKAKADQPSALGTQAHYGPGKYKDYNTFGSESDFPLGTDWTTFELGDAQGKKIPSGAKDCQTVTFDCVPLEGPDNTFYFIFEEFSFTEEYVLDSDRTLGTPEEIALKVNEGDDEEPTTIDATAMLNTFELPDFSFLDNGKDGIKLLSQKESEDEEDTYVDTFSGMLNWYDGGFVNAEGYNFTDLETGISIRFDNESIDGNKINLLVWNDPNSGITFEDGKTLDTQLAVSQSGWYYIYKLKLMNAKDYEAYQAELAGISNVVNNKKANGIIYDLMGRKVTNPTKGIYIQDGKKFIQK